MTQSDSDLHRSMHELQDSYWREFAPGHAARLRAIEERIHPGYRFPWRIAEVPAVVPTELFDRDLAAMRTLLEPFAAPDAAARLRDFVPERFRNPAASTGLPKFIATDYQRVFDVPSQRFRWCVPEIQSFPGNMLLKPTLLLGFQEGMASDLRGRLSADPGLDTFAGYLSRLGAVVVADADPAEVAILEVDPLRQKTVVDMLLFVKHLGVRLVDVRDARFDEASGTLRASRAVCWNDGRPTVEVFPGGAPIRRVLSRCVPDDLDAFTRLGQDSESVQQLRGIFQRAAASGAAHFVVHPEDFFVLSKASLPGHPSHHPPLFRVDADLLERIAQRGFVLADGVLKPGFSAGGSGVLGVSQPLVPADLDAVMARVTAAAQSGADAGLASVWLWQPRYGYDPYAPVRVPGLDHDPRSLYHELRIMWLVESGTVTTFTALTAMTRFARAGTPANAGHQKTPFTGTHGVLIV